MDDSKYKMRSAADYRDLSDLDFVRNLDLLASKYYPDYMQGRAQMTGSVDSFISKTSDSGCVGAVYALEPPRRVEYKGVFIRRPFFLFLVFLCSLIEIVYAVLSFIPFEAVKEKLPLFAQDVTFFEPIKALFGVSSPVDYLFSGALAERIPAYATCGCLLLFALLAVLTFVLSLCAMSAKRRKNGTFAKYRFDVVGLLQLLSAAGWIVCLLVFGIRVIGAGSILLAVLSLLTLFFGCLSYKKAVVLVPETFIGYDGKVKEGFSYSENIVKKR